MWLVAIVLDTAGLLVYMVYTWVRVKFRHLHLPPFQLLRNMYAKPYLLLPHTKRFHFFVLVEAENIMVKL